MTNRAEQNWPEGMAISVPRIIAYRPDLAIQNTKYLAPGLGLRFLECIESHTGELIAKMWHREMPTNAEIVVTF